MIPLVIHLIYPNDSWPFHFMNPGKKKLDWSATCPGLTSGDTLNPLAFHGRRFANLSISFNDSIHQKGSKWSKLFFLGHVTQLETLKTHQPHSNEQRFRDVDAMTLFQATRWHSLASDAKHRICIHFCGAR